MIQQRIGVFGGTFDPVHVGHLIIAAELRFALALDRVLFVPAGDPPHKPDLSITPAADRLRMLDLAIAGRPEFAVDTVDLERSGPSYTKDTLSLLQVRHQGAQLVFLMGEDSLRDLHTWREPDEILRIAEIGVGCRPGVEVEMEDIYRRLPTARGRVRIVDVPLIEVSSRDLRARAGGGRPICYQVVPEVERYILQHRLYRVGCTQ